jgi:hypothetical protein
MASNSVNLAVRLILEITGLVALTWLGWNVGRGTLEYALAAGIPLVTALTWGTFAVVDDPSRS